MKKALPCVIGSVTLLVSILACQIGEPVVQTTPTESVSPQVSPVILQTDLVGEQNALTTLYEEVNPGVVAIWLFDDQSEGVGLGSGWIYDSEGHIVTNNHVVEGVTQFEVHFSSGYKAYGTVVGNDQQSDLAVLKVDVPPEELVPLPLGDSNQLSVGQIVIAIGSPFALENTMTTGVVSALGRTLPSGYGSPDVGYFSTADLIQTDAAINPGNSGGPLLNLNGEVIGVNQSIQTTEYTDYGEPLNMGIGFAISVSIVKKVVPSLIQYGSFEYPYLGISAIDNLSLHEIDLLGLTEYTGAYVIDVVQGGPADNAGVWAGTQPTDIEGLLAGGDLIIGIDGQPVRYFDDILGYLYSHKSPGETVTLTLLRGTDQVDITVTLGIRP